MVNQNDSTLWNKLHDFLKSQALTWIVLICTALLSAVIISEADPLWQARLGLDILAGGSIVAVDSYSWTAAGTEYLSNSWLWNVLLGLSWESLGTLGIVLISFFGVALTSFFILKVMRSHNLPWWVCTFVLMAISILARTWLSSRPQLADYILSAFFLWLCFRKQYSFIGKNLLLLTGIVVIILWNNLHLTGIVAAFLFAGLVFVSFKDLKAVSRVAYTLAMLISGLAACLLTPYGLNGILKPLTTVEASVGIISEWFSPWTFYEFSHYLGVALILLFLPVAFNLWKNKKWTDALLITGLVGIASYQNRWVPFLAVIGSLWLAHWASEIKKTQSVRKLKYAEFLAAAFLVPFILVSSTALMPISKFNIAGHGANVAPYVPADCKLLNVPEFGGPMLLFNKEVKVSLDGRNDMYGEETYIEQNNVLFSTQKEKSLKWIEENGITCVAGNQKTLLQGFLLETEEWEMKASDGIVDLLVKKK